MIHSKVDDAAIVTMLRVLELAWDFRYKKTAPYTPDELSALLGRTKATLWRHLKILRGAGFISTKRVAGRRLVIQILIPVLDEPPASNGSTDTELPVPGHLRQTLAEVGILGQPLRELSQMPIDPTVVRAWHLWAVHQDWMDNPTGYVIQRLRNRDEPPAEFLELARLTDDEVQLLREAYAASEEYCGWPSLDHSKLRRLAPLWAAIARNRMR